MEKEKEIKKLEAKNLLKSEAPLLALQGEVLDECATLRTIVDNGVRWYLAKDVCVGLGYTPQNTARTIERLVREKDQRFFTTSEYKAIFSSSVSDELKTIEDEKVFDGSNNRGYTFINKNGLYSLTLNSRKTIGSKFRDYVIDELIPAEEKRQMEKLELMAKANDELRQVIEDKDKALDFHAKNTEYLRVTYGDGSTYTAKEIASIYGMEAEQFNVICVWLGLIYRYNTITYYGEPAHRYFGRQPYVNEKWFAERVKNLPHKTKAPDKLKFLVFTEKGRHGIYEMFKKIGIIPSQESPEPFDFKAFCFENDIDYSRKRKK